jgi:hypothetical protein
MTFHFQIHNIGFDKICICCVLQDLIYTVFFISEQEDDDITKGHRAPTHSPTFVAVPLLGII